MSKTSDYIMDNKDNKDIKLDKVVSIPVSLYESIKGRYFVGQTAELSVANGSNAWAGLINPHKSHINVFTNVFTISNFSDYPLIAQIWLNATFPSPHGVSDEISPTNTSQNFISENKAEIWYKSATPLSPFDGVNVYDRIVPPKTTLVSEEDGKFISRPGGDYVIFIKASNAAKVIVALGWWEKPRE